MLKEGQLGWMLLERNRKCKEGKTLRAFLRAKSWTERHSVLGNAPCVSVRCCALWTSLS